MKQRLQGYRLSQPNNEPIEDANPFAPFSSASALIAYIHKRLGSEVLKRVLAEIPEADSEWLSAQADQLKTMGLKDVAAVVVEAASQAPPLAAFCLSHQHRQDVKSSLASYHRNNRFGIASIEYLKANVDQEMLDFMYSAKRRN
jgi:hypothetical protein